MSKAEDYILAFKRGEDFTSPSRDMIVNGQPDAAALKLLAHELAEGESSVRENIVELLVDMGLQVAKPKGIEWLGDPQIISLLANAGLAKSDLGSEAAMDALRKLVKPQDLLKFSDIIIKNLETSPTEEAFLLVAKAKPKNALTLVQTLAKQPDWQHVEATKVALSALGDKEQEDIFIEQVNKADETADGKALSLALGTLALIGTHRSLKIIAEHLRTPLTIDIPGAYEKSVRLNVLEALLYNFPDQSVLYPNNIITENNYMAAEAFCIKTFGVVYSAPPPPFMTYRGYPLPMPE